MLGTFIVSHLKAIEGREKREVKKALSLGWFCISEISVLNIPKRVLECARLHIAVLKFVASVNKLKVRTNTSNMSLSLFIFSTFLLRFSISTGKYKPLIIA